MVFLMMESGQKVLFLKILDKTDEIDIVLTIVCLSPAAFARLGKNALPEIKLDRLRGNTCFVNELP